MQLRENGAVYFRFRFFFPVPVMYSVTTVRCLSLLPDLGPLYFICAATETDDVGVFPYVNPPYMLPVPRLPGQAVNILYFKKKNSNRLKIW